MIEHGNHPPLTKDFAKSVSTRIPDDVRLVSYDPEENSVTTVIDAALPDDLARDSVYELELHALSRWRHKSPPVEFHLLNLPEYPGEAQEQIVQEYTRDESNLVYERKK
jgi:hypothetical protein